MAKKNNSDFIDIKSLINQYISKWYLFVISVLVCCSLAWLYTKIKNPEYAVRANVLISQENANPMSNFGALGDLIGSNGYVDDEIFVLSSHSLYRDVAKDLGLNVTHKVKTGLLTSKLAYPDFPVQVSAPEELLDTLKIGVVFKIKINKDGKADIKTKIKKKTYSEVENVSLPTTINTPLGKFTISTTDYYVPGNEVKTTETIVGYNGAAELLDLDVVNEIATKRSNVINMAINTTNPFLGECILNDIIKKYNERGIAEKQLQGQNTAEFIDMRLSLIADDLKKSEAKIQEYKQEKGIIDVQSEAVYQTQKKGQLESELLTAETKREITHMVSQFLRDPKNKYSLIPLTIDNEGMQASINAYNDIVLQRINLQNSAKTNNVALKQLSEQIDAMRANILTSIDKLLQSSDIQIKDLRREKALADSRLGQIPTQEREYLDMKRQQSVKQQIYMFLLQRREENAMILVNSLPKGIIVDEAFTLSEPLGMTKKILFAIALVLGLCIPPAFLYIKKIIRNRFETRQEVERNTDVPILGEMCNDRSGRSLVVTRDDNSSSSELFRLMRSNLLFILNDPKDKVVLMTSSTSGEGKSFISINLAASLALLGKKVLLVGMDIRKPRLADYLGIHPQFGLTQYLSSDKISVDQIISHVPGAENLDVICAGPVPPNPAELLASAKTDELFVELRKHYDYIIVDTAPIGLVSDTFALDRIADASIFVCRINYTTLSDLSQINEVYEQHRLKKLSLVINGSAEKKRYGYGDKHKQS